MVNLTSFLISSAPELNNLIGKFIYDVLYQGIGNFGWTVVIFTIILKVVLSPLDIWQKHTMLKNNRAMKIIAPELEKLKKTYANAPDVLQQKQMELYKKNGYSMMGGCLPAIITIVIFFVVFSGFNAAVRYENERIVYELTQKYESVVEANPDITTEALDDEMVAAYNEEKQDWLWNKNVFMSDTYAN
ncbi:MAG: YidC/Oxa1 family membrane protein insertase, partial [Clostridia bacterium]|nr:YidC/Oxa1 family membrane protein insertase [Clostridia bacterium]